MRIPGIIYAGPERRKSTAAERRAYREEHLNMGNTEESTGDPKVTLSLSAIAAILLVGFIGWAASLLWTKADGAAPQTEVQQIDTRLRNVETGQVLLKKDVESVQEDITETKEDVKDIKHILERRFGSATAEHAAAAPER